MKKLFLITLLYTLSLISHAQENFSMDSWKVSQYEMDMTEYEKDPDAEALVIFNKGVYRFVYDYNEGFRLVMKKHIKIKILSQAGEKYASFNIPYYLEDSRRFEYIEQIEGKTFNLQNNELVVTELENKNIFEEKINANWNTKKLTMPNARAGSVIELEYTIKTPYFFNMRTWEFQMKIPVVHSKLEYRAIPYFEYVFSAKGISTLDQFDSKPLNDEIRQRNLVYKEMLHTFGLNNIPAFKDEEFITSENDYMKALHFQISRTYNSTGGKKEYMSTWSALCTELLKDESFGKMINNYKKEAKKILPMLALEGKDEIEKVKIITEYVKMNYNWNGYYSKYTSQKPSKLQTTKIGNVADLNLLLIGLLKEAELEANPIILSTRNNGVIDKAYPFMHLFNYVIAEVTLSNSKIHLDATEPLLAYNVVPTRCINIEGLVVKPKGEEIWIDIHQKGFDYAQKQFKLQINPENMDINVNTEYTGIGNSGFRYRTAYLGKNENLIKLLKNDENIDIIGDISIKLKESLDKPFSFEFKFNTVAEKTTDKIFLNPFCDLGPKENPFKQNNRSLPIDLVYISNRRYISEIIIPEGYKIESIPENEIMDTSTLGMNYFVNQEDRTIKISANYWFTQNIYGAEKYDELKLNFAKMLSKFSEMLVFTKE